MTKHNFYVKIENKIVLIIRYDIFIYDKNKK
jgi:hypothetical protein